MGLTDKLQDNIVGWGTIAIVIVIMSVVLLKFKSSNVGNITCQANATFNVTPNNCFDTANPAVTYSIQEVGSSIDTFVSALSEPKNWVGIVIIALIGFAIVMMFKKKSKQ